MNGHVATFVGLLAAAALVGDARAVEPGYQGPCALAIARDGRTLFVAASDARQVLRVELPSGRVAQRWDVPAEPTGLALTPDGARLVVTCAAPKSTVLVLDAATGRRLAAIAVGHTAMSPALSADGRRLYVCNRFDGDISVVDLAACRETARVPVGREPVAAVVAGEVVLAACHLPLTRTDRRFQDDVASNVTLMDARTHQTAAIALPHGSNGVRGMCATPDGRYAFVTHLQSNFEMTPFRVDGGWINVNVLSIIDVQRRKLLRTVGLDGFGEGAGNPWDVICADGGKTICVSLAGVHQLAVLECRDLLDASASLMTPMMGVWPIYTSLGDSPWRRIKLAGKGPRGLAAAGGRVYAAEYFSDAVAVADLATAAAAPAYPGAPVATAAEIRLGPPPKLSAVRRGELLFHDATICYQQWQSCASCHPDGRVDGLNWDLENDGEGNPKNTKSMVLAHRTPPAMAEGVRMTAEEAVRSGIKHILFTHRPEEDAAAIDAYLQSLRPAPSPRLVEGRLSPAAERGQKLFHSERIACHRCHPAPLYADLKSHNVGTRRSDERTERFDTPTLVEVWRTAPYLHDGRYTTMGQLLREGRHGLGGVGRDELSDRDLDDLIEFVNSL